HHKAGEKRAEDRPDDVREIKPRDSQANRLIRIGRVVAEDREDRAERKRRGGDDEVRENQAKRARFGEKLGGDEQAKVIGERREKQEARNPFERRLIWP